MSGEHTFTANPEAAAIMAPIQARAMAAYGDVARGIKLPQYMINAQLNKIKL